MCRRVTCGRCGRPTFSGCGAHVEQVLSDVPKPERCQCRDTAKPPAPSGSWFGGLFGKGPTGTKPGA